ncbi:MAG: flavodoxin family protein [Candidatus Heimdallarchaeota archaeon]|nr:flavodoxin family protein [Candidatus Heimdallarchaeota archaeon]
MNNRGGIMKLLLIHGSPRKKGNTTKISKLIEEQITTHDDVEFEWLFLKDYPLNECLGCHLCIIQGEDNCPLDDSREKIQERMEAADGIILICPMYSFHVSTMMKTFIDHFTFLVHRPRFHKKKAMVVGLAGGPQKEISNYLTKNARAWGFDVEVKLNTIAHLDSLRPKYEKKNRKSIRKATEKFYRKVKKNKIKSPSIYDLVFFKMWQHNALVNKEELPKDYDYWQEQGWFDTNYYFKVRINPFKRLLATFAGKMMKMMMHRVYKNY